MRSTKLIIRYYELKRSYVQKRYVSESSGTEWDRLVYDSQVCSTIGLYYAINIIKVKSAVYGHFEHVFFVVNGTFVEFFARL